MMMIMMMMNKGKSHTVSVIDGKDGISIGDAFPTHIYNYQALQACLGEMNDVTCWLNTKAVGSHSNHHNQPDRSDRRLSSCRSVPAYAVVVVEFSGKNHVYVTMGKGKENDIRT